MKRKIYIIAILILLASFQLSAEALTPYKLIRAALITEDTPVSINGKEYTSGACSTANADYSTPFRSYVENSEGTFLYGLGNKYREVIITLAPTGNFTGSSATVSFYLDNMLLKTIRVTKNSQMTEVSLEVNYLSQLKIKTSSSLIAILNVEGK